MPGYHGDARPINTREASFSQPVGYCACTPTPVSHQGSSSEVGVGVEESTALQELRPSVHTLSFSSPHPRPWNWDFISISMVCNSFSHWWKTQQLPAPGTQRPLGWESGNLSWRPQDNLPSGRNPFQLMNEAARKRQGGREAGCIGRKVPLLPRRQRLC